MSKIARAYVLTESDRDGMARAAGIPIASVFAADSKPVPTMRPGELLAVYDLTVFGDNRDDIAAAVRGVRNQGADIIEIGSGRLCGDGAVMMVEALQKLAKFHPTYKGQKQAAIDTARKRTDDGRCSPEKLFELWGSAKDIEKVTSESGWPQSSIYRHFKMAGISREIARLEMANRRKAKRKK